MPLMQHMSKNTEVAHLIKTKAATHKFWIEKNKNNLIELSTNAKKLYGATLKLHYPAIQI